MHMCVIYVYMLTYYLHVCFTCVSICMYAHAQLCRTLWPHGLWPARLFCPWNFPGNNTGVGCHFLLQEIFLSRDRTWSPVSPASASRFFTTAPPRKPINQLYINNNYRIFAEYYNWNIAIKSHFQKEMQLNLQVKKVQSHIEICKNHEDSKEMGKEIKIFKYQITSHRMF